MLTDPNLINNIILAVIAIANAMTALFAYRNHTAIQGVKTDVAVIEKATNSMKDDLVKAAGKVGQAQGFEEGRQSEINRDKK